MARWIDRQRDMLDENAKVLSETSLNFQSTGFIDDHAGEEIMEVVEFRGRQRKIKYEMNGTIVTTTKRNNARGMVAGQELVIIAGGHGQVIEVDQAMRLLGQKSAKDLLNALRTRRNDTIFNIA